MGIAVFVFGQHVPHRVPSAEIIPTCIERHHLNGECAAGAVFHDGVIDRFCRNGSEFFFARADKLCVLLFGCPCDLAGLCNVGAEGLQGLEPDRCTQDEHACVPKVAALLKVFLGGFQARLFDEGRDGYRRRSRFTTGELA